MTDERDGERDPVDGAGAVGHGLTRGYVRRPHVEAEIVALPDVAAPDFMQVAARAEAIETLVHAIRRLVRAGNAVGVEGAGDGPGRTGPATRGRYRDGQIPRAAGRSPRAERSADGAPLAGGDRPQPADGVLGGALPVGADPRPRSRWPRDRRPRRACGTSRSAGTRTTQRGRGAVDEPAGAEDWDPELLLAEALSQLEGKVRPGGLPQAEGPQGEEQRPPGGDHRQRDGRQRPDGAQLPRGGARGARALAARPPRGRPEGHGVIHR